MPEQHRLSEVLLIAKDRSGEARVINLSGLTIELSAPAPDINASVAAIEQRLAEARKGLEFYADKRNYQQRTGKNAAIMKDGGDIARDTLKAIKR